MERLTWKDEAGYYAPKNVTFNCLKQRGKLVDRLAAYEDLEEQGRLVVLPCKVGDILWRIETVCYADKCPPYADDCGHCTRKREKVISPIKMLSQANIFEWSKNIGIDLFLTKAEAEAAMKGAICNGIQHEDDIG